MTHYPEKLFFSAKTQEIKKPQKFKMEFIRNLQHELRAPLVGITSLGQVLKETYDKLSEEQRKNAVKTIRDSSERLNNLINNILDLSKLLNSQHKLELKEVNLTNLVYNRSELCKKLYYGDKNSEDATLDLELEDGIHTNCDEYYLGKSIENIILNSMHCYRKEKITVALKGRSDKTIEFSVIPNKTDNSEEKRIHKDFELEQNAQIAGNHKNIRLALAQKTIELHKGKFWIESENEKVIKTTFVLFN